MDFATWEPVYEIILDDFGFGRGADETARDRLAALVGPFDLSSVDLAGQRVAVAGAAPSLEAEAEVAASAETVVAASTAGRRLEDVGVAVDYVVTDLDGDPGATRDLVDADTAAVVHGHGDNVPAVEEYVPTFQQGRVLPTTQAEPVEPVQNFGGFTDGDRAAFFADHFGAAELVFPGWDFDDPDVDTMKARKLQWAERLLYWLENRRGERFAVLDGRREGISPPDGAE